MAVRFYRENCFAFRGDKNKRDFCGVLTGVTSCLKCKFFKTQAKYEADQKAAEERVKRIATRKCK